MYKNNLEAIRAEEHLTQAEMATKLDMNTTVYARYERGERDIPLSVAKYVAQMFDKTIDYIACMEGLDVETLGENQEFLEEEIIDKFLEEKYKKERLKLITQLKKNNG